MQRQNFIADDQIDRLARCAGIIRVSSDVYNYIRDYAASFLDHIIRKASIMRRYEEDKTLKSIHIEEVLPIRMFSENLSSKKCKRYESSRNSSSGGKRFRPGVVALREIRYYQKQDECLFLQKSKIENKIRNYIDYYSSESTRITEDALLLLQYALEHMIVNLLRKAYIITISRDSKTLKLSDLVAVREILSEHLHY